MSLVVEVEVGAFFHNAKAGEPIRVTLEEMGHPQPATQMHMDNYTVDSIVNNKEEKKRTKAMYLLIVKWTYMYLT